MGSCPGHTWAPADAGAKARREARRLRPHQTRHQAAETAKIGAWYGE